MVQRFRYRAQVARIRASQMSMRLAMRAFNVRRELVARQDGVTMLEYAVIALIILVIIFAAFWAFGGSIAGVFSRFTGKLNQG